MRIHNNKSAILIISLWITVILSIFAIGLAHKLSFEIKLLRNRINGIKAFYAAKAGVQRALAERQRFLDMKEVIYADSFNQPWLNNEAVFKDINFGECSYSVKSIDSQDLYGMSDEQSKININKVTVDILKALLIQIGLNDNKAIELAPAIISQREKIGGFDAIEELLTVNNMTGDIFYGKNTYTDGIIKYITVYGSGMININTASGVVLTAVLGKGLSDYILNTRRWFIYEGASPGVWFVSIGQPLDALGEAYINKHPENLRNLRSDNLDLGADERIKLVDLKNAYDQNKIRVASFVFRINSSAVVRNIKSSIEVVAEFDDKGRYKFIYWNQK